LTRAEDIVGKTDQKEQDTDKLRRRMDIDYDLWSLRDYNGPANGSLSGYLTYTTNEPRTFGRKMVSILSSAAMTAQVPQDASMNEGRGGREENTSKERFTLGNFNSNDERLGLADRPPLRSTISWQLAIRGRTCGRAMLVKKGNKVWADATPFDPRNVMWESSDDGLLWLCHKYYRTRAQVEDQYGVNAFHTETQPNDLVLIYDYYDRTHNTLVIPAVKDEHIFNRRHGMGRVPCWNVASTLQPLVMSTITDTTSASTGSASSVTATNISNATSLAASHLDDSLVDYGESIYGENRHQYETHNFMMSVLKNLAARSLKPVFGIESAEGTKLVEGDPFQDGSEIPLATGEKLIVYDFLKSAPDLVTYLTVVSGEFSKGGLPSIFFGESPIAISGFAMQNLRGGGKDKVVPLVQAEAVALKQISNNWSDHFNTGAFGQSIELSGRGTNRKWFSADITVEELRDLPQVEITLTPELPEDQAGKIQQAAALSAPMADGMPTMSRYDILETVLERQDPDADYDRVLEMMAIQNPLVQAHRFVDALAKIGDVEAAQYWQAMWEALLQQFSQSGANIQNPIPPGVEGIGNESPGENGFSPEVLPNQVAGIPSPTPGIDTPFQTGPNVPPGTPRPGAQGGI